jgi:triosephosphate isomerase
MNKERRLIIAGNWKMNKTVAEALDLVRGLRIELGSVKEVDLVVCPPFTALADVSKAIMDSNLRLGAQNMSEHNYGAFTGEIAAGMLKEFSVRYVILGHSERRQFYHETSDLVAKKARAAHAAALKPIVCVGETLQEREGGKTESVLDSQVRGSLAGLTREQIEETHLGHRHGQNRDERAGPAGPRLHPQAARLDVRRKCGPARPPPIRRQRQAFQRARTDVANGRGRRPGGRRFAGGPQFF